MKISIIIPTKDRLKKLNNVFRALDKQTNKDFEILVINDGEHELFLKSKHRIRIFNSNGKGVSAARNIGINNAYGQLLIFIGDDMYPNATFVNEHYLFHEKYSNSNFAMLGLVKWCEKIGNKSIYKFLDEGAQFDFKSLKSGKKVDTFHFYTSNLSIKKSFIDRFNEEMKLPFFEDIELAIRLTKKHLVAIYNPKAVVRHDHPYDEKQLVQRAFQMGAVSKILENKHVFKKVPHVFSFTDRCKLFILCPLNKIGIFQLRYYHYLYTFNFINGYDSDKYINCKSQ